MLSVFAFFPLLALFLTLYLYKHNGKRIMVGFDLYQFFICFVLFPSLFLWTKVFVFLILRRELGITLTTVQLFVVDTLLSLVFLYVSAFVAIHAVTKTFRLHRDKDPEADLFLYSEWFHLWLSHIVIYVGGMSVLTFASMVNGVFPFYGLAMSRAAMFGSAALSFLFGNLAYIGIVLSDPKQGNFLRLMKLFAYGGFLLQTIAFLWWTPGFNAHYIAFWAVSFLYVGIVVCSLFLDRSDKPHQLLMQFKHEKWGENIQVTGRGLHKKQP